MLPEDLAHRAPAARHLYAPVVVTRENGVCMSPTTVGVAAVAALALTAAVLTVVLMKKNQK